MHGIQIHSPNMNLFLVAVSEEHLQYWIAGLNSLCGLPIPSGIAWSANLHGPIPRAPLYLQRYREALDLKRQKSQGKTEKLKPIEKTKPREPQPDFVDDDERDNEDDDAAEAAYLRKQAMLRGDFKKAKKKSKKESSPQSSSPARAKGRDRREAGRGIDDDDDDDDDEKVVIKRPSSKHRSRKRYFSN